MILIAVLVFSCKKAEIEREGVRPVYLSYDDFSMIKSEPPRDFGELGKIVAVSDFLLINEVRKGIHLIDNRNPTAPQNIRFFSIPGNREFILIANILYADNGKHLILIDITDIEKIEVIDFIEDVYEPNTVTDWFPENYSGWFECANDQRGIVLRWEEARLMNPKCRTNR